MREILDKLSMPIKTTRNIVSDIQKFESLSLKDTQRSRPATGKSKITVLDADSEGKDSVSDSLGSRPSESSVFTPVSISSTAKTRKRYDATPFLQKSYLKQGTSAPASLPEDAREILKNEPEREDLSAVFQYLQDGIDGKHGFNIRAPSPKASQIINTLVTVTIPDQWLHLRASKLPKAELQLKKSILACLNSVAGIGALLMQIRHLASTNPNQQNPVLADMISILGAILDGRKLLQRCLNDTAQLFQTDTQRRAYWQEVTSLLAGSKIFTTMSQVYATAKGLDSKVDSYLWMGDGSAYSEWLASNISYIALGSETLPSLDSETTGKLRTVLQRGLNLGYRDAFVSELYTSLVFGPRAMWTVLHTLITALPSPDQKIIFDCIICDVSRKHLQGRSIQQGADLVLGDVKSIAGAGYLVSKLIENNVVLEAHVVQWLTDSRGEYAGFDLSTRRAVFSALAHRQDTIDQILQKCLQQFGDKLQIQHTPAILQEASAQTILLALGSLSRLQKDIVKRTAQSSVFIHMVSNRLGASIPRARFLGMVVAVAASKIVDKPDKVMNFGTEEMEREDAKMWLSIVQVHDTIGSLDDLKNVGDFDSMKVSTKPTKPAQKARKTPKPKPQQQTSKIISIEELPDSSESDDSESEDDDLVPYTKPDSDPEDSDEDPTLINRKKPTAPVYITSLIAQLNKTDDLDQLELSLKTAPSLIRRKANFGDELADNLMPLASTLLNLSEGISSDELQKARLDALLACTVAKPFAMGPWLCSMYFEGDFSLSQRAALLTCIGLGVREIAGLDDGLTLASLPDSPADTSFPSKRLPSHLSPLYTSPSSPLPALTTNLSQRAIQPMAAAAADKLTGPNILKIRTFSSRMEVEKRTRAAAEARRKRIPKDLHALLAGRFYLPLLGRLGLLVSRLRGAPQLAHSPLLHVALLRLHLQTLVVVLATMGPHAAQLGDLTRETLLLLTALHAVPVLAHDPAVLPALMHLLLLVLELNVEAGAVAEERLVTEHGAAIAELVQWSSDLGSRVSVPEAAQDGDGMPWSVLVAACQVKWSEVGRKFQGRMLGIMGGTYGAEGY